MSFNSLTKPTIIGLYGISGSGKSTLLRQLKNDSDLVNFAFYDGSVLLDEVTPGSLAVSRQSSEADKIRYREQALDNVSHTCRSQQKMGVVAGHYTFWDPDHNPKAKVAGVDKDWETYTHMVYLNPHPDLVKQRWQVDIPRNRLPWLVSELREWQTTERTTFRHKCLEHGIEFTSITKTPSWPPGRILQKIKSVLINFHKYTEASNTQAVELALKMALGNQEELEKVLVFDADKTLAPQDTGTLFWEYLADRTDFTQDPLKVIIRDGQYSHAQFRQAMLRYDEVSDFFEEACEEVAEKVELYPEMVQLLARAAQEPLTRAVIATCGRSQGWKMILPRYGLSHVEVIGSGCLSDGCVMTGAIKGHIVDEIHDMRLRVIAFGESPLDVDMLKKADRAFVVVGEPQARSKSIETKLEEAIAAGLKANQILLPVSVRPHLDLRKLPKCALDVSDLNLVFRQPFIHATKKNVAKLLQTPTRDARNAGHELRQANDQIGHYLAMEYLSGLLGVEEYEMPHVQGKMTEGYRFKNEGKTLIVPLMRGGEPMAFGMSKALKTAAFAHAHKFEDLLAKGKVAGNLDGKETIILVDSVINSGKSIVDVVVPLRQKFKKVRVIVVAGVVQAEGIARTEMAKLLETDANLTLVALQKSDNRFTGKGTTDTGHRLFNTTYLD